MLINMICQMKGIIRADDIRLVLTPDFIVMDLECIEEHDRVIMKSINKVMPLVHYRELQNLQMVQQQQSTMRNFHFAPPHMLPETRRCGRPPGSRARGRAVSHLLLR